MANNTPTNTVTQKVEKQVKVWATDEAGMMNDAKKYAKLEWKQHITLMRKLKISEEDFPDDTIGKALILVKYEAIKESRLNRTSIFDEA